MRLSTMPTAEATTMGGRESHHDQIQRLHGVVDGKSMKVLPPGYHRRILFTGWTLISGVIS